MYYKQGWLTTDREILNLLKDGEDQFVINSAERILRETPEKVILNCARNAENWRGRRRQSRAGFVERIGIRGLNTCRRFGRRE